MSRQRARKLFKRKRGGALLGETQPHPGNLRNQQSLKLSKECRRWSWTHAAIGYGLKKPQEHIREGQPLLLRKRTRLKGTEEILDRCDAKCQGRHQHTPVLGGVQIGRRWKALSDFAGGYTKKFPERVIQGAEKYLRGRKQEVYVQEEELPEERFEVQDDEMMEDQGPEEPAKEEEVKLRKNDQLQMLHRRLGHPSNEVLSRILRLVGADKWLVDEAAMLK